MLLAVVFAGAGSTQDTVDTTRTAVDSTMLVGDSTLVDSLADTALPPDTAYSDTLSGAEQLQQRFEERYKQLQEQRKEELAEYVAPVAYLDSLTRYFAPERLDRTEVIDRSFFHDAGGYFRFDPSFFIVEHQVTPMRTTVRPYTLSGDRTSVLAQGRPVDPFEHIVEPDGLIDMNDIPTALDERVYILEGPAGAVFGADQAVATLLTLPGEYGDYDAHSAFLVDKGSYGYSYARARYLRKFRDGRDLQFSLGYRNADGPFLQSFDDAYHYTADFYVPISGPIAITARGRLYDREGPFRVQPDISPVVLNRDRFDRSADLGVQWNNSDQTANWQFRYRHLRKSADVVGSYLAKFNQTGHGATALRQWVSGQRAFMTELTVDWLEYDEGFNSYERTGAGAYAGVADLSDGWRYAARAGTRWSDDFDLLPDASVLVLRESDRLLTMFSAGFATREPTLHELHLPFRRATIYPAGTLNYGDRGNEDLQVEKQLIGSGLIELGSDRANINVRVTGGRIIDGIDWRVTNEVINGSLARVFSPVNGDIDFLNVAVAPSFKVADLIRFSGGGSYHITEYEIYAEQTRPYAPDYQVWAGAELHVYWPQKLIHLFAYGEVVYTSSYDGYFEVGLGQDPVFNARLSLKMGNFRFHYIFQNLLNRVYEGRENYSFIGRFNSYGFVWEFLD
ncbi:hypothetical protein GF420_00490 [candidate division GN15 bacterium]|nr:hypothetical protein [candidate division GN15 bacterium]